MFKPVMSEDRILEMVSKAQEFDQIKVSFLLRLTDLVSDYEK